MEKTLVKMENVTKEFPGVKALDNINFSLNAGEVHILLGENGAGKSTLMKILSGAYNPTSGKIFINEKEYSKLTPKDSKKNGISIIYQELSVINELSIMENIFVGKLPTKKKFGISTVDYDYMKKETNKILNRLGMLRDPETFVENISISEKQQVEIAKALFANSQIIIMDEPTTSLTSAETEKLFNIIKELKQEGKGIIYISHKMNEIKEIGDRVTVLKDGKYVGTKNVNEVETDDLVSMMVGREIKNTYRVKEKSDMNNSPIIFEVKNLSRKDKRVKNVSFTLHKEEILGFAGLVGSGRSELMNSIFGSEPRESGEIYLNGKKITIDSPYEAIKNGLGMVTENRRETGFLSNFNIQQNISVVSFLKSAGWKGIKGFIDNKLGEKYAKEQVDDLNVKCTDISQNIVELSGGNQQKVILGKWLAAESDLIIFDEPTKGIDVGSKNEIYQLLRKLASNGKGVLVVSSELPELLAICDNIIVFKDGEIAGKFSIEEATEEKIIKASTGMS